MPKNETPQNSKNAWWRPEQFESRADYLVRRADIIKLVREFFDRRGYVEVETPALQVSPGMEEHISPFETSLLDPWDAVRPVYLHTSPEFAMKKLLAAGMQRIFQLARVFRNGERTARHHPEFTLLEWYQTGADWRSLAEETIEFVRTICGSVARHRDHVCNLSAPWEFLSVAEAVERFTGIDLLGTTPDPLKPDTDALRSAAEAVGVHTDVADNWDDIFFRIFLDRIEPNLGIEVPIVLHSYPASMSALARISPDDPRVSDRFEIFICGLELANGYSELTDADECRTRFLAAIKNRIAAGGEPIPVDEALLAALNSGIPDCAGIALGVDRLVMLATGAENIEDVLWAPVSVGLS